MWWICKVFLLLIHSSNSVDTMWKFLWCFLSNSSQKMDFSQKASSLAVLGFFENRGQIWKIIMSYFPRTGVKEKVFLESLDDLLTGGIWKTKTLLSFGCFKNKREILEDKCVVEVLAQQLANSGCIITTRLPQLLRASLTAMFRKWRQFGVAADCPFCRRGKVKKKTFLF